MLTDKTLRQLLDDARRRGCRIIVDPKRRDLQAYRGANLQAALAMIYATVGLRSQAIDLLEHLLSIPSQINTGLLRHDPRWAVLRGDPRFEKVTRVQHPESP